MCTRIADCIGRPGARTVIPALARVEAELKQLHARIPRVLDELPHCVGHVAEVLRDDPLLSERRLQRVEKVNAGALFPVTTRRVARPRRDGVVLVEATEVIDTYHIEEIEAAAHPGDPPVVARLRVVVPVIDRIAPELAGRRKAVRRAARDLLRLPLLVELEQLRMLREIHGITRYIDRDIADDGDALFIRVGPEALPLPVKLVLREAVEILRVVRLCGHELRVGRQPVHRVPDKLTICLLLLRVGRNIALPARPLLETLEGLQEQREAAEIQLLIADLRSIRPEIHRVTLRTRQQLLIDQRLQIDEIRIAREGREALIRRIAIARRADRKHLPVGLPARREEIHEAVGLLSECSDAVGTWKSEHRHQYACCPPPDPLSCFLFHTFPLFYQPLTAPATTPSMMYFWQHA